MAKAILELEMPQSCRECPFYKITKQKVWASGKGGEKMKARKAYSMRDRFSLGQRVEVIRGREKGDGKYYSPRNTKGIVVGIYDYFIVIDNGKYRESFSYADIAIGRIQVKAVKAA